MGLSRTVSEINGDFSRKLQNCPLPYILRPAEIGYRRSGQKKLEWAEKKKFDDVFGCVDTIHQRARQTDGHERQQRPRLRIASRGKNDKRPLVTCRETRVIAVFLFNKLP